MTDKQLADIICRALLAIVAGLRKKYDLPSYHNIVLIVQDQQDLQLPVATCQREMKDV